MGNKVDVWMECNAPVTGAQMLGEYTFSPVFPLGPGALDTCRDFMDRVTQMWPAKHQVFLTARIEQVDNLYKGRVGRKICGGLKTYNLKGTAPGATVPYDFTDPVGWRALVSAARRIAKLTGTSEIILDCETALEKFYAGQASIDFDSLLVSLNVLNKADIDWIWWGVRPLHSWSGVPDLSARSRSLVQTIRNAVDRSVFITDATGYGPDGINSNRNGELFTWLRGCVGPKAIREIIYVRESGRWERTGTGLPAYVCYTFKQAWDLVTRKGGTRHYILYPNQDFATLTKWWMDPK